jgi:dihydroflavonol-4-reductase
VVLSASDRILVTGASGFVGSAVAGALARRGYPVRALVRPSSRRDHLGGLDLEFVEGDLRDTASLRPALQGARYLFHVAADYRLWARRPEEILEANVEGTRRLMEEARRAGIERIVYTSSIATLTAHGKLADETTPITEAQAVGAYKRSKVTAERLVEAMACEGLPVVIVNPTTPIGPRDVKPTPTGRIIVEAASGRMPGFVDTGLNFIHVDDVAEGHVAALEQGRTGERYVLGGENVTLADLLADIAREVGIKPPRWRIPRGAIYPVAFIAETVARMNGHEPFVTRDGLRMAKYPMFASAAKAERELGLRARPYREGIADAMRWFRDAGYFKR